MKKKKNNENILGYRGEKDRSYGLAGMAVALASLDAFDKIAYVELDAPGPMIEFSGEYYYAGAQAVSPKAAWRHMVQNLQLTGSMALANVLARCLVNDRIASPDHMLQAISEVIRLESHDTCQLDDDETEVLLSNLLSRQRRIFQNPRLHPAIEALADTLRQRRSLSASSLIEEMHLLRLI